MKCIVILSSVVISVMQRHVNYARIHNNTVSCRDIIPETTVRNIRKSCNVHGSPYKISCPPSQPRFFAWLRRKVQSQAHRSNGESPREREKERGGRREKERVHRTRGSTVKRLDEILGRSHGDGGPSWRWLGSIARYMEAGRSSQRRRKRRAYPRVRTCVHPCVRSYTRT